MGELVKCDHCSAVAKRPRMRPCPDGWLYLETDIDDIGLMIVWACSLACALGLFRLGPGPRLDA